MILIKPEARGSDWAQIIHGLRKIIVSSPSSSFFPPPVAILGETKGIFHPPQSEVVIFPWGGGGIRIATQKRARASEIEHIFVPYSNFQGFPNPLFGVETWVCTNFSRGRPQFPLNLSILCSAVYTAPNAEKELSGEGRGRHGKVEKDPLSRQGWDYGEPKNLLPPPPNNQSLWGGGRRAATSGLTDDSSIGPNFAERGPPPFSHFFFFFFGWGVPPIFHTSSGLVGGNHLGEGWERRSWKVAAARNRSLDFHLKPDFFLSKCLRVIYCMNVPQYIGSRQNFFQSFQKENRKDDGIFSQQHNLFYRIQSAKRSFMGKPFLGT